MEDCMDKITPYERYRAVRKDTEAPIRMKIELITKEGIFDSIETYNEKIRTLLVDLGNIKTQNSGDEKKRSFFRNEKETLVKQSDVLKNKESKLSDLHEAVIQILVIERAVKAYKIAMQN